MVFCGQCGLQLAPGDRTCPRCGAAVDPNATIEDPHSDDPTMASPAAPNTLQEWGQERMGYPQNALTAQESASPLQQPRMRPFTPPPQQQKLVLRPGGAGYDVPVQGADEAIDIMRAPATRTPSNPNMGGTYPVSYPGFAPQGGAGYPGQYGAPEPISQPPVRNRRGRNAVLLTILIALLLLLTAVAIFTFRLNGIIGGGNPAPTPTLTASQQAQNVIQQYYTAINRKDYQSAYNLWYNDPQHPRPPLSNFANGYAHTQHDDVTIDSTTPLADGTVQVNITLHATEDAGNSVYQGFYIVGPQQNGEWQILSGQLNKIG